MEVQMPNCVVFTQNNADMKKFNCDKEVNMLIFVVILKLNLNNIFSTGAMRCEIFRKLYILLKICNKWHIFV